MARYRWVRNIGFVDKETGQPMESDGSFIGDKKLHLVSEIPEYKSPVTGKMIDARWKRKEEMKREMVREVDPSEFKPCYRNLDFIKKRGIHESKWGEPIKREAREHVDVPDAAKKLLRKK